MLNWIRQQLIGGDVVMETPFGLRRLTYADYVASGRSLAFIENQINERVLPFYANTHTEDSFTGAYSTHITHQAAEYIKQCLGADPSYKIAFCGTGSTAAIKRMQEILGLWAPSSLRQRLLDVMQPNERPVVFVGPYEHHSNEVSWRETLAEVVEIPLCPEGKLNLEALEQALQNPVYAQRPKIGSFSAASNVTGLLTDTRTVAEVLHRHGAWVFFDFAASAPYVEIDMKPGQPDGYDAVFISAHKFVGGPGSPGILVFNQSLYQLSAPSTPGGGTVTYVNSSMHRFVEDIETREDAGTPAILQKIRAAWAFWVKQQVTPQTIHAQEERYIQGALARLSQNPKVEILGNTTAPRLAFLSFLIRSQNRYLHPRFVVRLLSDLFGIQSRGGCACAGPYGHQLLGIDSNKSHQILEGIEAGYNSIRPGWVRLNFNYFISEEEYEFLLSAIEFVAEYGERFLPLYQLDWLSGAWTHPQASKAPDLFDLPKPRSETGPVPYQHYLQEAHRLAAELQQNSKHQDTPSGLREELVFFNH